MSRLRAAVSMRALVQRINRKLAPEHRQLKKARGGRTVSTVGEFYILDTHRNFIREHHIDPEALAKELGVLAMWEEVDEE